MAATNIFGRGMGALRMKKILKQYPNILTSKETAEQKVEKVARIGGFAKKTAQSFVTYIPAFMKFIHETGLEKKLAQKSPPIKTSHALYEKKIALTGFRDKELTEELSQLGAQLASAVGKTTFVVLVKDIDEDTGKAEKARTMGIPVMTPKTFRKKYL